MAQIEGLDLILTVIQKLSQLDWIDDVLKAETANLNADAAQTFDKLRFGVKPGGNDSDFAFDSGKFYNSWLNSVKMRNGEIIRASDLDYADDLQVIAQERSPSPEGFLTYSEQAIEVLLGNIGNKAERIWQT
jgi:hypothetical protein